MHNTIQTFYFLVSSHAARYISSEIESGTILIFEEGWMTFVIANPEAS